MKVAVIKDIFAQEAQERGLANELEGSRARMQTVCVFANMAIMMVVFVSQSIAANSLHLSCCSSLLSNPSEKLLFTLSQYVEKGVEVQKKMLEQISIPREAWT